MWVVMGRHRDLVAERLHSKHLYLTDDTTNIISTHKCDLAIKVG